MTSTTQYRSFNLTGPVNVVHTSPRELQGQPALVYILMGSTGAGKSTFIESLSDGTLSISKDSLESVTQEVVCYKLVNLTYPYSRAIQMILMDTPGFLDTKLSESRIVTMILRTLEEIHQSKWSLAVVILYLHPITDIRLGASKRDVAKYLMEFSKSLSVGGIIVATTMWNTIHTTEKLADAEARLVALRADIFKSLSDMPISVSKFEFSRESALLIMDNDFWWLSTKRPFEHEKSGFQSMARDSLLNRIGQAEKQLQILADDRIYATTPGTEDDELLEIIERSQKTVAAAQDSFLTDLYDLDPSAYQSNFPNFPFPPHPHPHPHPTSRRSFITRLKRLTPQVPFQSSFRKQ